MKLTKSDHLPGWDKMLLSLRGTATFILSLHQARHWQWLK